MKGIIKNFMHYRHFLLENVKKDIKLKYRSSYLGLVWTLVEPLLEMIVLTYIFGTLFGNSEKSYPVYILCGRLLFRFYSGSTKSCVRSIRANSGMIKKVYVPKYLYPLSSILSNYVTFGISLIVLAVVSLVLGVYPTWYTLGAIVPLLLMFFLAFGTGMILATAGVFFRDCEYLWSVMLTLIMYTCAIFYKEDRFAALGKDWILKYNPLYCIIKNFRLCIIDAQPLDLTTCLYALAVGVVLSIIGLIMFNKNQDKFILHV